MRHICVFLLALLLSACVLADSNGIGGGSSVFDYIVVGGGVGGAITANRLSADPNNRVLLVHLGPKSCPSCDANLGANLDTAYPYINNALPVTQQYLLLARKPAFPQNHGLGGNGKRFGGVHTRPSDEFLNNNFPAEFNATNLRPNFLAIDDHYCHYLPESITGISAADCIVYHGKNGEMSVVPQVVAELGAPMQDLVKYLGTTSVGNTTDYNDPRRRHGIGYEQRWGAMANKSDLYSARSRKDVQQAFLPESLQASRPNLVILPFTRVTRVVFSQASSNSQQNGRRAVRIEYMTNGIDLGSARATKHIFLCGGALETPKLLELSGVGSASILNALNIPVVANNTAVGENLRAHHAAIMAFKTKTGINQNLALSSYNAAQIFLNISATNRATDFQVELLNGFYVRGVEGDANGLPADIVQRFLSGQFNNFPYIAAEIEHNDVSSIGSTHITSRDPTINPTFDYGWGFNLFFTQDIPRFLTAIAKIRDIFTGNNTFANTHVVEEIVPGREYRDFYLRQNATGEASIVGIKDGNGNYILTPEQQLTAMADTLFLQQQMTHFFHITGTCSLGSCTNLDGEVKGVQGLSVCDASVLPANPDGNPSTTILAVCDKIAKIRLQKD